MAATLTEKVLARAAGLSSVSAGEPVSARPDHAIAYDFPGFSDRLFDTLEAVGRAGVPSAAVLGHRVMFIDHLTTRRSPRIDAVHAQTRAAAARHGFELHEGLGIGHQVACELGLAAPGALIVHFDPHVAAAGAHGALALGIGSRYETIWATGVWHTRVPAAVQVVLQGRLSDPVDARDLAHELVRTLPPGRVAGAVLEFDGPGLRGLSLGQRQTLCAMSVFTGAVTGVCLGGVDDAAAARADPDARYADRFEVDLARVEPLLVRPGSARPEHTVPVAALRGERITRAYVGSCSSGRIDDLRAVATMLEGRTVAAGVRCVVVPTSEAIRAQAGREGLLARLERAGVEIAEPSCDRCYGFADPLADDDVCLSSGTLNVAGRMGSARARIVLASAATVAASAAAGCVVDPREAGHDASNDPVRDPGAAR